MIIFQEASEEAYKVLLTQGLTFPDRPESEIPELPDDITELSDELLMQGYSKLVAWTDFAATQAAVASVDEREAERAADNAELAALGRTSVKGVAVAKAIAASDPEVVKLRALAEKAHHYRKLVEVVYSRLERDYALFSRELTRRTSINPMTRKDRYTS